MKLTLDQIDQAYAACSKIKDEKLNIKTAYKLLKLVQELEEEIRNIENFSRELILEYCEKDDAGNPIMTTTENGQEGVNIPEENRDILNEKLKELGETEIEIKDYKFNFSEFDNLTISFVDVNGLCLFIDDDE